MLTSRSRLLAALPGLPVFVLPMGVVIVVVIAVVMGVVIAVVIAVVMAGFMELVMEAFAAPLSGEPRWRACGTNSALCGFSPERPPSSDDPSGEAAGGRKEKLSGETAGGRKEKPSAASGRGGNKATSPWERRGEGVLAKPGRAKELARRRGSCNSSKLLWSRRERRVGNQSGFPRGSSKES